MTVEVGHEKVNFSIHGGLLSYHSVWFRKRLNGNWGDNKVVELPDDRPETFRLFFDYAYRNQIPSTAKIPIEAAKPSEGDAEPPAKKPKLEEKSVKHSYTKLAQLYVFADIRQCPYLKAATTDAFMTRCLELFNLPWTLPEYIWSSTPDACGLRRLVMDYLTHIDHEDGYWSSTGLAQGVTKCTDAEFLGELVIALYKSRVATDDCWSQEKWTRDCEADPCRYHDHQADHDSVQEPSAAE